MAKKRQVVEVASTDAGCCNDAVDTFCAELPTHPEVPKNDNELEQAIAILWDLFVSGANALGNDPEIPPDVEEEIKSSTRKVMRRKIRFWKLCQKQTEECAYSAGVIANAACLARGKGKIKAKDYTDAKRSVQALLAYRAGKAVVGIAC